MYCLLVVLLSDLHISASIGEYATADGDTCAKTVKLVVKFIGFFLLDAAVLTIIRHVAIRYAIHCLIPYTMSGETWPMRFWHRVNPAPNRPNERYYYYGYDDAYGDYDYGAEEHAHGRRPPGFERTWHGPHGPN